MPPVKAHATGEEARPAERPDRGEVRNTQQDTGVEPAGERHDPQNEEPARPADHRPRIAARAGQCRLNLTGTATQMATGRPWARAGLKRQCRTHSTAAESSDGMDFTVCASFTSPSAPTRARTRTVPCTPFLLAQLPQFVARKGDFSTAHGGK